MGDVSLGEAFWFVVVFAIPALSLICVEYAILLCFSIKKGRGFFKALHPVDFAMPIIATYLWIIFQQYSLQTKSFGNIFEVSILGFCWGLFFLPRGIMEMKGKRGSILFYVALECVIAVSLALLAPTFSE